MLFEHRIEKKIDSQKAWDILSDMSTWIKWDPTLLKIELDGELKEGQTGTKYLKRATHDLPFVVEKIEANHAIILSAKRGPMTIINEYCIEDSHLVFRVKVDGGIDKQQEIMFNKTTRPIPMIMNRLSMMISPIFINKEEALNLLFNKWEFKPEVEYVTIENSLRRELACDLYSKVTLPLYRVSVMDGIAVNSAYFKDGTPDTSNWKLGKEYVRADTGDDFPDDYDSIIMIEDVEWNEDGSISLHNKRPVEPGSFTRPSGSTIVKGDLLLKKGTIIRPTDLAVIAMGNVNEVPVVSKPTVAFIPTGSELVKVGSEIKRGDNIDTNSYMVEAQLKEMGASVVRYPIIKDDKAELEKVLDQALSEADIVIINGGSSKGEEDFNTHLLKEKGEVLCHNVAAVPGRPISISIINSKPVINVPGPALAAFYVTNWCIQPMIDRWYNHERNEKKTVIATLTKDMDNGGPVQILHRMQVTKENDQLYVTPIERNESQAKILSSNAQYISELFEEAHLAGDKIEVEIIE